MVVPMRIHHGFKSMRQQRMSRRSGLRRSVKIEHAMNL